MYSNEEHDDNASTSIVRIALRCSLYTSYTLLYAVLSNTIDSASQLKGDVENRSYLHQ